jgi:GT2 family glycosyltransferase
MSRGDLVQPLVIVVVLNWNGREDTLACLRSLQGQSYPNHRILVVDNGSTDGSGEAVRQHHPDVEVLQTGSNLGFAGGNNAGIAWALRQDAGYVLLLNNDTEVAPDLLERLIERAQSDPSLGIVGARIAYHSQPERLWAYGGGRFDVATGWVRHLLHPVPESQLRPRGHRHFYITGCAMLLRRELIEEIGVLDEGYFHFCEDVDLCLRAERAGFGLGVAPGARLLHKVSATTRVSSPLFLYYNLRSRLTLVRRHGPPGAPRGWSIAMLWLRLWRPALLSGMGVHGWSALRLALRDYGSGAQGPAPRELQTLGSGEGR